MKSSYHLMPDDDDVQNEPNHWFGTLLGNQIQRSTFFYQPTPYSSAKRMFDIVYVQWHDVCIKKQDRSKSKKVKNLDRNSEQVLPDKEYIVKLELDFHSTELRDVISDVQIQVKKRSEGENMAATLFAVQLDKLRDTKLLVTFNLAYVGLDKNGSVIYKLSTSTTIESKTFVIIVNVFFNDGDFMTRNTKEFLVVGKNKKRKHNAVTSRSVKSPSTNNPRLPNNNISLELEEHFSTIQANDVYTQTLDVDHLKVKRAIISMNADIAYHFEVADNREHFEEGEIVCFLPSSDKESEDARTEKLHIEKITKENATLSSLKGVISRSYYFDAHKPKWHDCKRTETVCMMGVVPVQVVGPVFAQDSLYVSSSHPGVAVASSNKSRVGDDVDATFIGVAFSERSKCDPKSIGLVRAAVSLEQSVSQQMFDEQMAQLQDCMEIKTQHMKDSKYRSQKRFVGSVLISLLLFILTVILLWQLLTPGSRFKYWRCEKGHKDPKHFVTFNHKPAFSFTVGFMRGIEFRSFEELAHKVDYEHDHYRTCFAQNNGFRYYLNTGYCAYGRVDTHEKILPPLAFAVDRNCTRVYEFVNQKWLLLNRTRKPPLEPSKKEKNENNYDKYAIWDLKC